MVFNSLPFAIFLPIVLAVYYRLSTKAQNAWLLAASWFFYAWWDARLLVLLLGSILLNYWIGLKISGANQERQRKRYLWLGVGLSLAILGFFKYHNFFIDSAQTLGHLLGWEFSIPVLKIALPIGISFYTFLGLSYLIDVYYEKIPVCQNFVTFGLFISYFPLLVSGPIVSPAKMIPAIESKRDVNWKWLREGSFLILLGLFKKVGVADALSPYVGSAFQNAGLLSGKELLLSIYLFAVQIYCDFSGYSDMARGVSKLFGIDLMINFNQPYFSQSITEFWRRWHISLSTWFRNYVFIPLEFARKRQKFLRQESNMLIVFLLTGLWHGANWTFVIWGGLHGMYLCIEKWFTSFTKKKIHWTPPAGLAKLFSLFRIFLTFNLVSFTWIFFRSDNLNAAWNYLSGIFTWRAKGQVEFLSGNDLLRCAVLTLALFVIDFFQARTRDHTAMLQWPWLARSILYAGLLVLILVLGGLDAQAPFIYFQF